MILVDTSVWVDHLRFGGKKLAELLDAGRVLAHPFVICELALGSLRRRDLVLNALRDLPRAIVASDEEIHFFVGRQRLYGLGIGYVDAHRLTAARLMAGASLWTRDERLRGAADRLGMATALP